MNHSHAFLYGVKSATTLLGLQKIAVSEGWVKKLVTSGAQKALDAPGPTHRISDFISSQYRKGRALERNFKPANRREFDVLDNVLNKRRAAGEAAARVLDTVR